MIPFACNSKRILLIEGFSNIKSISGEYYLDLFERLVVKITEKWSGMTKYFVLRDQNYLAQSIIGGL